MTSAWFLLSQGESQSGKTKKCQRFERAPVWRKSLGHTVLLWTAVAGHQSCILWDRGGGLAVFCREPEFASQNAHGGSPLCFCSFGRPDALFRPLQALHRHWACTYSQVKHSNTSKRKKWNYEKVAACENVHYRLGLLSLLTILINLIKESSGEYKNIIFLLFFSFPYSVL